MHALDLPAFEDKIVAEFIDSSSTDQDRQDCENYLRLVSICTESKATSGGIVIAIMQKGELRYVAIDDVRDLFRNRSELEREIIERAASMEREMSRDWDRDSGPSR